MYNTELLKKAGIALLFCMFCFGAIYFNDNIVPTFPDFPEIKNTHLYLYSNGFVLIATIMSVANLGMVGIEIISNSLFNSEDRKR